MRRSGEIVSIIDNKWKAISEPFEGKGGMSQADVYQLMAYARIYDCDHLVLLYPSVPGGAEGERKSFGMTAEMERLRIA